MKAEVITDKCYEIFNGLSSDAVEACVLVNDYADSLKKEFLVPMNTEFEALDKFCKEHKSIRGEISAARDKVRAIIKEDENSPDCSALPTRRKIKKLEHEIEQAKKKKAHVSPKQRTYDVIAIALFILGIALLAVSVINFFVGAFYIVVEGGMGDSHEPFVSGFWKYLIFTAIDAAICFVIPSSAKRTKALKSELSALYSQLNSDEECDKLRRTCAIHDEQRYSLILDLIDSTVTISHGDE